MSSIEGIEDPFGPGAPSAAKCGYPAVTRRSSPSAPSARKSTKASHQATTEATAPANNTRQINTPQAIRLNTYD